MHCLLFYNGEFALVLLSVLLEEASERDLEKIEKEDMKLGFESCILNSI